MFCSLLVSVISCAISFLLLTVQQLCKYRTRRLTELKTADLGVTHHVYAVARLLGCLFVQSLTIAAFLQQKNETAMNSSWLQFTTDACIKSGHHASLQAYCSILALLVVVYNYQEDYLSAHLTCVLLTSLGVYTYRDLWPLVTINETEQDSSDGGYLWVKILCLATIGMILPLTEPRNYVPVDPENPMEEPSAEQTASWFSSLTFSYLDGLVFLARRKSTLTVDDLPPLVDSDRAELLTRTAMSELDPLLNKKYPHVFWSLLRIFKLRVLCLILLQIALIAVGFISQIALNRLLNFLEKDRTGTKIRPSFWIACLFLGPFLRAIVSEAYTAISTRNRIHIEVILTQTLLQHSLRVRLDSNGAHGSNLVGKINNLATSDIYNISLVSEYWIVVMFFPLRLVSSTIFLYLILDWSAFVGLAVMLISFPLPGYMTSILRTVQVQKMKKTDIRVQHIVEAMNILRKIKLLGWVAKIKEQMDTRREDELVRIRESKFFNLLSSQINLLVSLLMMIATFATYTLVLRKELTASTIFSSIAVFEVLRTQFQQVLFSMSDVVNGKVSMDRYTNFMREADLLDVYSDGVRASQSNKVIVGFGDASFSWNPCGDRSFTLQVQGDLVFNPGMNLIIGPTGAGKTSLLLALLGEMHYRPLTPDAWHSLPREGGIAYVVQESWVRNETIKDNILFGSSYDEERYKKGKVKSAILVVSQVLYQCALLPDLELFSAGDRTEIGERGVTLSGGQKARITLARAIYSSASILLLDDPLAALDVHTAKWVVEKCLGGDLVKGKTIIMVTHNITLMGPMAQYVITLGLDGQITHGPPGVIANGAMKDGVIDGQAAQQTERKTEKQTDKIEGKITAAEELEEGTVKWPAWKLYFSSLSERPFLFWMLWIGCVFLNETFVSFQAFWLGTWSAEYEHKPAQKVPVYYYLSGYSLLLLVSMVLYSTGSAVFIFGQLRAGRRIYSALIESLLGATLRWLDVTPISRVIVRTTLDIKAVDDNVSGYLGKVVDLTILMMVKFGAVLVLTPSFVLPGLPLCILTLWLGRLYMNAQMPIKRTMSNAHSPILGHFLAAIAGLASIRAYGIQEKLLQDSLHRLDMYIRPAMTYWNLNRWICIRTDTIGGAFTALLAIYLVYSNGTSTSAANAGFSLTMAVVFSSLILIYIRHLNALELTGNKLRISSSPDLQLIEISLERVLQYINIEQEPMATIQGVPPAYWPSSGDIRVENLSARYSPDGPAVLHDISFRIRSGEHMAIVGRTGSGKSSLTLALLRCIPTNGQVYYDGLATSTLNLDALRNAITTIPQQPELISGTLRDNLDPFSEYDDAILTDALRSAGLYALQSEHPDTAISLDSLISAGGSNVSIGQRQIIGLAQAIVRKSKVLILDEATSAIDYKTDAIIQQALRVELADVTLITVAHRLETVMDFDKIMVLDKGRIVEYDTPLALLRKEKGFLRALVNGSADRKRLMEMAGVEGPKYY